MLICGIKMLLIRLKQQRMSVPLLECYHSSIIQGMCDDYSDDF